MEKALPTIPAKRYFTIGEVSELCGVKPYVLRYWEQEFTQLKPMKRRGNRRYYQHHEVLLIRRIRELLYDHGFTISGARNRLADGALAVRSGAPGLAAHGVDDLGDEALEPAGETEDGGLDAQAPGVAWLAKDVGSDAGSGSDPGPGATHASAAMQPAAEGALARGAAVAAATPPATRSTHLAAAAPQAQERAVLRAELLSIRELLSF